ncbi:hypothetical protein BD626DRAFT_401993 [Schizophyllum amplum]|uniref:Fungal-type protein kinase domain-containing protein n=1 Tax=Schizophyllum amplum TaxID=97359 RepID=A0A550CG08_9AGAR|nr:hypothetical protein BD626DRAFT_401993 [Auriculariopsis ampla]
MMDKDTSARTARQALCADIRDIPQVAVQIFLDHFMPPPPVDVDILVDKLSRKSDHTARPVLSLVEGAECWEAYRTQPARRAKDNKLEHAIYSDLEHIGAQIAAFCCEINGKLKQTTILKMNGTKLLPSVIYTSAEPDGVRVLVHHQPSWGSAAITEEYELRQSAAMDNHQKVIWNMFHSMRTDVRRRFVFGLTIENTTVRLWHMNREVIIVSEPFDMNKDWRIFADVYARFSFASSTRLGYDDTIVLRDHRQQRDGHPSYRIFVDDIAYITTETLANYAVHDGFGRSTRVFRAYRDGQPATDDIYAIKDNWLREAHDLEFNTYKDIMTAIEKHDWSHYRAPPVDARELNDASWDEGDTVDPRHGQDGFDRKSYFIKIIAGILVKTKDEDDGEGEGSIIDNTLHVISGGFQMPERCESLCVFARYNDGASAARKGRTATYVSTATQESETSGDETAQAARLPVMGCFERKVYARMHHRSVMLYAQPLDKIKSASLAFKVLSDASYALFIMHQLDLCHRDMSPYNVLSVGGQGVLADFEYVKRKDTATRDTSRTGTANFMAVEVMRGNHLRQQTQSLSNRKNRFDEASDEQEIVPWEFRDVHDLESVWWIALWLLFRDTAEPDALTPPYQIDAHKAMYPILFPGVIDDSERSKYLTHDYLRTATNVLPPHWKAVIGKPLKLFRRSLSLFYDRENVDQRLFPTMWYEIDRVVCAAGEALTGQLVPFVFDGRAPLVEERSPDDADTHAIPPPPVFGELDLDRVVTTTPMDEDQEKPLRRSLLNDLKRARPGEDDETTGSGRDGEAVVNEDVEEYRVTKKAKHGGS